MDERQQKVAMQILSEVAAQPQGGIAFAADAIAKFMELGVEEVMPDSPSPVHPVNSPRVEEIARNNEATTFNIVDPSDGIWKYACLFWVIVCTAFAALS
jgi:hypothetical protein